jgi:hypothetical protein
MDSGTGKTMSEISARTPQQAREALNNITAELNSELQKYNRTIYQEYGNYPLNQAPEIEVFRGGDINSRSARETAKYLYSNYSKLIPPDAQNAGTSYQENISDIATASADLGDAASYIAQADNALDRFQPLRETSTVGERIRERDFSEPFSGNSNFSQQINQALNAAQDELDSARRHM